MARVEYRERETAVPGIPAGCSTEQESKPIVDDNPAAANRVRERLSRPGYRDAGVASTGGDAIAKTAAAKPDPVPGYRPGWGERGRCHEVLPRNRAVCEVTASPVRPAGSGIRHPAPSCR